MVSQPGVADDAMALLVCGTHRLASSGENPEKEMTENEIGAMVVDAALTVHPEHRRTDFRSARIGSRMNNPSGRAV